jgi:hypothetical protein
MRSCEVPNQASARIIRCFLACPPTNEGPFKGTYVPTIFWGARPGSRHVVL